MSKLKHILLFESFSLSNTENREMLSKYSKILTDKANSLTVSIIGNQRIQSTEEVKPTVKILGTGGVCEIEYKTKDGDLLIIEIFESDTTTVRVFKSLAFVFDIAEFHNIIDVINDAKEYIEFLDDRTINRIKNELSVLLFRGDDVAVNATVNKDIKV